MNKETVGYPDYPRSVEMTDHAECVEAFEKYAKSQGWCRSTWWDEWRTWKAAVRWARRPATPPASEECTCEEDAAVPMAQGIASTCRVHELTRCLFCGHVCPPGIACPNCKHPLRSHVK